MAGHISKKPHLLVHAWSQLDAMTRDDQTAGAGDGELTLSELQAHIDRLAQQREQIVTDEGPTGVVDLKINYARRLYKDMVDSGAGAVQYLPDGLMGLPVPLRQRATELLLHDDVGSLGDIDQFVINHARDRYAAIYGTGVSMMARQKALDEINQLAQALGLS